MLSNTIICLTYHKSDEKQQKLIFYGSTHSHKRSQNLSVWTLVYLNWGSVFFYCGRPLPLLNRYGKAGSEFCTFCTLQSLKTDFGSCDLSSYWHNQLIDIKAVIHLYTRQTDRQYRPASFLIYPPLPIARTTLTPRHGNQRRRCEEGIREVRRTDTNTNSIQSLGTLPIIFTVL